MFKRTVSLRQFFWDTTTPYFLWECSGSISGKVSRPTGCGFEPHQPHCAVSLSKKYLSLLSTASTQEDLSRHYWKFVDWDVKNQIKQTHMFCLRKGKNIFKYTHLSWGLYVNEYFDKHWRGWWNVAFYQGLHCLFRLNNLQRLSNFPRHNNFILIFLIQFFPLSQSRISEVEF